MRLVPKQCRQPQNTTQHMLLLARIQLAWNHMTQRRRLAWIHTHLSMRLIFGNLCANSLTMPTGCLPAVLSGGHLSGDGRRLDDGATGHSGWACVSCVAVFWAAWSS